MNIHDLYGFTEQNIDAIASVLESVLDLQWEKHDSSYFGEYYLSKSTKDNKLSLKSNFGVEEEGLEPQFSAYPTLLYISGTETVKDLEALILASTDPPPVFLERVII